MIRKIICALFVLALGVGIAFSEEFGAIITKVEDGKVTFTKTKFDKETKKFSKGNPQTLPVAEKVKVVKSKFNKDTKKMEAGDAIEDGLKNKMFSTIGEKGLFGTIVTDKDKKKITEIRVFTFGKKKGKDK